MNKNLIDINSKKMITHTIKKTVFFFAFIAIALTSCDSDKESISEIREPKLIDNYYFKGDLDGEQLNMEVKIYDLFVDSDDDPNYNIDFGGSQTHDREVFGESGTGFCYGRYAYGLGFYESHENYNKFDTAKMYFSRLPVGECTLENELTAMRDFFETKNHEYERLGDKIKNAAALDFFPAGTKNQQIYYSSRLGDNTDASFEITSTEEIENGTFVVEGKFSCKLYRSNDTDDTDYKELKDGKFRMKVSNNLKQ